MNFLAPKGDWASRPHQSRNASVDQLAPIAQSPTKSRTQQAKAQNARAAARNRRSQSRATPSEAAGRACLQDIHGFGKWSSWDRYFFTLFFVGIEVCSGIPQKALESSVEGLECELLRARDKAARLEALLTNHEPSEANDYKMRLAEMESRLSDLRTSYLR